MRWQSAIGDRAKAIAGLNNRSLAARAADLLDVGHRVGRLLAGARERDAPARPDDAAIVVAPDLSPSDTAALAKGGVLGFCTAHGGPTAHSAIIARALGIPAVVGAGDAVLRLADETTVVLDGSTGTLVVDPDPDTMARRATPKSGIRPGASPNGNERRNRPSPKTDTGLESLRTSGALMRHGERRSPAPKAWDCCGPSFCSLIGRPLRLSKSSSKPTVTYALALEGKPVTVRTLDIGGDKPLPYVPMPAEANPFLGVRGIRFCLQRPQLLREQLRAVLRATKSALARPVSHGDRPVRMAGRACRVG